MRSFTSAYPPQIIASNLYDLPNYPLQTFDVWLGRRWPGALAVRAGSVRVERAGESWSFTVELTWGDRREVMFPEYTMTLYGAIEVAGDGSVLTLHEVRFHPNYRSWTAAMGGAGVVALALFPVLWRVQGLTVGTLFVGVYGVVILTAIIALWGAYRRAVRRAGGVLLRQAAGLAARPVTDWHTYYYPDEQRGQYTDEG